MTTESTLHTKPIPSLKYDLYMIQPVIEGQLEPQNIQFMKAHDFIQFITAASYITPIKSYIRLGPSPYASWGLIWPHTLQSGAFDGSYHWARYGKEGENCGSAAICRHRSVNLPTANPQRGLHDQFCELCGLDTSYDSSD
jgi:hypothetical protein